MKLGGSLERSRRKSGRKTARTGGTGRSGRLPGWDRVLLYGLGLALFGWTLGWLVATQIVFPMPPPPADLRSVPDLRGLDPAEAQTRLSTAGLTLGEVDSLHHPSVAAGVVLGQSPLPGQLSQPDAVVRVTYSLGAQRRAVPDVSRLSMERARIVLEAAGFEVAVDSVESALPQDRVVTVSPRVDSMVTLPAVVEITVSTGPALVTVPRLLGMDREEARAALDSLGLQISDVEEVFRFGRDQDLVIEQEPPSGAQVPAGSGVRLRVGRGRGEGGRPPG